MSKLIEEINELDNGVYKATYIDKNYVQSEKIWNSIKGNKKILEIATQVVKDKFGDHDTFLATAIVEWILIDYENIDKELYQSLVNKIYSNTDLARTVLDGYSNGGYSFLLYTLFNDSIDLTEEQKTFAIDEAMNKIGTTKDRQQMKNYELELVEKRIADDVNVMVPEIGPVGAKTYNTYMKRVFSSMDTNQAHGIGEFDIRYHILKNHNFADKVEHLIYDFWADDEDFEATVDYWEESIINLCFNKDDELLIDGDDLMFLDQEALFASFSIKQAKRIMEEINFVKKLHEIRPVQWEIDNQQKKMLF